MQQGHQGKGASDVGDMSKICRKALAICVKLERSYPLKRSETWRGFLARTLEETELACTLGRVPMILYDGSAER